MGLELIILVVLLFFGGAIWLGYAVWKKRREKGNTGPTPEKPEGNQNRRT
jgi:uncharacterized iron-regulated membrane protein